MKGISTLIVLFMATQLLFAQDNSMQKYISSEKAVFIANLTPHKTYKKLDAATTEKYNVSEMVAPMLLSMTGAEMTEEKIKKVQEQLADPTKVGLDIESEVYVWMQSPEDPSDEMYQGEETPMFFNVILPVKDGKKFRTFLDELFGSDKTKNMLPAGDAMNMIHNKMLLSWNKDRVILAGSTVQENYYEEADEFEARNKKMLMSHAKALGNVDAAKSIAQNSAYQQHLHKDSDFDLWMDYRNIMPSANTMPHEVRELYQSVVDFAGDMQIGGNGFFKKGSAEFLMEMYFSDAMARVLDKTYALRVNKDFFKYLDNTNLMAMYSMAISPEGMVRGYGEELYKILKETKEGTIITNMIDIVDIFVDEEEIFTLLKGDMLLALTDLKVVEQTHSDFEYNEETDKWDEVTFTTNEILPVATMMLSYGSKENIMKFIDLAANVGGLSKRAEGVWTVAGVKEEVGFDVFVILKDGVLMFTNDENLPKNLNGLDKGKQLPSKDIKDVTTYVQYGFLDVAKITSATKKAMEKTKDRQPRGLDDIAETFKRMEMKVHAPKDKEMLMEFRCILNDANQNSLQTLVDGVMKVGGMDSNEGSREHNVEEKESEDGTKKL